jgi:hypothetical protein
MTEQRRRRGGTPRRPDSHLEARYANYFEVGHNACEFIFEFGQYDPAIRGGRIHSRIVMGPLYAKLLVDLLHAALERFEQDNGVIQPAEDDLDPLELVKQSIAGYERRLMSGPKTTE